jgi:hypothetical protein
MARNTFQRAQLSVCVSFVPSWARRHAQKAYGARGPLPLFALLADSCEALSLSLDWHAYN